MKHGIAYCRVSSKEQVEGTSLESQELACREFGRSRGITVERVFVGRGESAKFADRPELLEILDYCRTHRGEVDVLLVWKLDRLARNVADHFNIKATLLKYGVQVISVTEPIDANPEGKLLETILAGFAQFDNDVRAMRTVQGMRKKLQDGFFPWNPPLGYRTVTRGEKKTLPDEPVQPLFGLLQKAWKTLATGAYTKAEMLRLMSSWGITTKKGEPLTAQSLDNFFRNPYYAGILVDPWSKEEYEGKHPPMVTREEFARVQQIVSARSRSTPHHRERPEFPLRGSVRCPKCQRYMTSSFSRGHGGRYAYYHCENRKCDTRRSHPAARIHEEFRIFLTAVEPKQELLAALRRLIGERAGKRYAAIQKNKDRLKEQAGRISTQIKELIRMRAQGLITDREFLAGKAGLSRKQASLEIAAGDDSLSIRQIEADLDLIVAPLSAMASAWEGLPPAQKRRFQQCVLPVGFTAGGIGTAELGLLFRVFRQFEEGNSHEGSLAGASWNQLLQEIKAFAALFDRSKDEEMAA
jgi:site-specific DNA recombinase